jgi:hypothetical protein
MATMFPNPTQGPAGPWPQAAVDARQGMIDFYGKILEAAKKVDPNATLTADPSGSAFININGKANYITSTHKGDFDNYGITPDQIVSGYFLGNGLNLTPEQRAKVQASQVSALQSVAGQEGIDAGSKNQVQQQIDNLKAFWQTPAGQGLDPNTMQPIGVKSAEVRPTYQDTGSMGGTPFAGYSVTPPAVVAPPVVKKVVETPPIVRATLPPVVRQDGGGSGNALAIQAVQPAQQQQPNQNYQRNLDRFRPNRWGRGGR